MAIRRLADDLDGLEEERWGNREAHDLGGPEVDHQLESLPTSLGGSPTGGLPRPPRGRGLYRAMPAIFLCISAMVVSSVAISW